MIISWKQLQAQLIITAASNDKMARQQLYCAAPKTPLLTQNN